MQGTIQILKQSVGTVRDAIAVIWTALISDARSYAGCCVGLPGRTQASAACCK